MKNASFSSTVYLGFCHKLLLNCKGLHVVSCLGSFPFYQFVSENEGLRACKRNVTTKEQTEAKDLLSPRKEGAMHKDGGTTIPSIPLIDLNSYLFLVSDIKYLEEM